LKIGKRAILISLNFNKFDWTSTDHPWVLTPVNIYEGLYSAKSATIDNSQTSGLEITLEVIGYDEISFYRKVSSEGDSDFLRFYIDDDLIDQWSGDIDWEIVSYKTRPGIHTFRWAYEKDGSGNAGWDCGWLDMISFPSINPEGELHVIANALPDKQCGAGESQLGAFAIGGSGNYTFSWTPAALLDNPNIQSPMATLSESTVFTVEIEDGIDINSADIKASVFEVPETPVIEQIGNYLTSSSETGNQWHNSAGAIEGATEQIFYPPEEDTYYTIVTNDQGCESVASNSIYFIFTGIDDHELSAVTLFPNPVRNVLHVSMGEKLNGEIEVFNCLGERVKTMQIAQQQNHNISFKSVPEGLYFVRIVSGDDDTVIYTKKIIVN